MTKQELRGWMDAYVIEITKAAICHDDFEDEEHDKHMKKSDKIFEELCRKLNIHK